MGIVVLHALATEKQGPVAKVPALRERVQCAAWLSQPGGPFPRRPDSSGACPQPYWRQRAAPPSPAARTVHWWPRRCGLFDLVCHGRAAWLVCRPGRAVILRISGILLGADRQRVLPDSLAMKCPVQPDTVASRQPCAGTFHLGKPLHQVIRPAMARSVQCLSQAGSFHTGETPHANRRHQGRQARHAVRPAMFLFEQFMMWWEVLLWEGIRSWREYRGGGIGNDDGTA
jgi:hypothetical protein